MRLLATAHLLMIGCGLYLMGASEISIYRNPNPALPSSYWIMVILNLTFLALLSSAAVLLWKGRSLGLKISLAAFAAELLYFFGIGFIWALDTPFSVRVAEGTGIGNMGIAPQELTGYPLIAGTVCVILLMKSKRRSVMVKV
jgi:hypothetical protein